MLKIKFENEQEALSKGLTWGENTKSFAACAKYSDVQYNENLLTGVLLFKHKDDRGWIKLSFKDGSLHSFSDEPALLGPCGEKRWMNNGVLHRETGPAMIYDDGYHFYLKGTKCTFKKWLKKIDCSEKMKAYFKLKWG